MGSSQQRKKGDQSSAKSKGSHGPSGPRGVCARPRGCAVVGGRGVLAANQETTKGMKIHLEGVNRCMANLMTNDAEFKN